MFKNALNICNFCLISDSNKILPNRGYQAPKKQRNVYKINDQRNCKYQSHSRGLFARGEGDAVVDKASSHASHSEHRLFGRLAAEERSPRPESGQHCLGQRIAVALELLRDGLNPRVEVLGPRLLAQQPVGGDAQHRAPPARDLVLVAALNQQMHVGQGVGRLRAPDFLLAGHAVRSRRQQSVHRLFQQLLAVHL